MCERIRSAEFSLRGTRWGSELRAAIDADGVACDPARMLRGQEGDHAADILGLRDALERLQFIA
jgi:hypothetical protein